MILPDLPASTSPLRRVAAAPGLVISAWPGELSAVVFSTAKASTQLVSAVAAELLLAASSTPLSVDEILSDGSDQALGSDIEDAAALAHDAQQVSELLKSLLDAGLLRSVE